MSRARDFALYLKNELLISHVIQDEKNAERICIPYNIINGPTAAITVTFMPCGAITFCSDKFFTLTNPELRESILLALNEINSEKPFANTILEGNDVRSYYTLFTGPEHTCFKLYRVYLYTTALLEYIYYKLLHITLYYQTRTG